LSMDYFCANVRIIVRVCEPASVIKLIYGNSSKSDNFIPCGRMIRIRIRIRI
jgi:hypothetical protein